MIAMPEVPEPPRPALPAPLGMHDLHRLKLVCYVPSATDSPFTGRDATPGTPSRALRTFNPTRLPYEAFPLESDHTTCVICQEEYKEPEEVRMILYKAEALRLLDCGHVYHVSTGAVG
jgi:hypothetical protein